MQNSNLIKTTTKNLMDNPLPLKAYPDVEVVNGGILLGVMPFISNLLSLTDEVSAKRLETALPSIKEQCWSMGFAEIKKMFEMYADGKLSIEPIPNYFDRILFGKIVQAYKQVSVKKTDQRAKEAEYKNLFDITETIIAFDKYVQDSIVEDESVWIYDYLEFRKRIEYTKDEKLAKYRIFFDKLKNKEEAIIKSKCSLIKDYFARLHFKGEHIKDYL